MEERVEFIKLLHIYGKRWIHISESLREQRRTQQQCRSHGQKYLDSLMHLNQMAVASRVTRKELRPE